MFNKQINEQVKRHMKIHVLAVDQSVLDDRSTLKTCSAVPEKKRKNNYKPVVTPLSLNL